MTPELARHLSIVERDLEAGVSTTFVVSTPILSLSKGRQCRFVGGEPDRCSSLPAHLNTRGGLAATVGSAPPRVAAIAC
jgi:hypothetical protein